MKKKKKKKQQSTQRFTWFSLQPTSIGKEKNFHYYIRKLQPRALKSQSPTYTQKETFSPSQNLFLHIFLITQEDSI